MDIKNQTVCFTGHRKIPAESVKALSLNLRRTLIEQINKGYRFFGAGGALGFDTIAAQTVLELKATYPDVKLILVLPCLQIATKTGQQGRNSRPARAIIPGHGGT